MYTWDITKLAGPAKGSYYDCYVMIDIYSRYIVGAHVHRTESAALAAELMTEIFGVHGVPQRGARRPGHLDDLQARRASCWPTSGSPDPIPGQGCPTTTPIREAWFKTLKYAPVFPDRFGSLTDARAVHGRVRRLLQP